MNKAALALLISLVVAGNAVTITLLVSDRPSGSVGAGEGGVPLAPVLEAIGALREEVDRLSSARVAPAVTMAEPAAEEDDLAATQPGDGALAARLDEVIGRLSALEKTLAAMKDVEAELAVAKLREERLAQFRAEDGFKVADELLAQNQFAVGANGILTFLEEHPDHPDARDLMQKAVGAFLKAGYGDKALWLQGQMMEKFPDPTGQDLFSLSMLKKQLRKFDDALRDIEESVALAPSEQHRLNRLFYRAFLIHTRDGDEAGLEAYREVERLAMERGGGYPADDARKRAAEIEGRLAAR
jgi:hypothetical protein